MIHRRQVGVRARARVYIYIYIYIYTYIHTYIYTYPHTHTQYDHFFSLLLSLLGREVVEESSSLSKDTVCVCVRAYACSHFNLWNTQFSWNVVSMDIMPLDKILTQYFTNSHNLYQRGRRAKLRRGNDVSDVYRYVLKWWMVSSWGEKNATCVKHESFVTRNIRHSVRGNALSRYWCGDDNYWIIRIGCEKYGIGTDHQHNYSTYAKYCLISQQ